MNLHKKKKVGFLLKKAAVYLADKGAALGAITVLILLLLISSNVILRNLFKTAILFTDEYSGYFLVFIIFMGLAYTAKEEGHVKVDLVIRRLPLGLVRSIFDVTSAIVTLIFACIYLYAALDLISECFFTNRRANTIMGTPMWIPQIPMCVGLIILVLERLTHIIKKFIDLQTLSKQE